MSHGDDNLRVRPGRIRDRGPRIGGTKSLVGQVMAAARKAGLTGYGLGRGGSGGAGSRFGRGRAAVLQAALRSSSRRVVIKARVVRHSGLRFRAASLATHLGYLKREGVTRGGASARLFDANGDADGRTFAGRCEEDRHHFRFIVSPEDAPSMADLRAFTRDLMAQATRDLGTRLDWVAIDHWNTDNPHVHILVRGVAEDGQDLVIARDYISKGLRARAEALMDLELGPRSEHEIRSALQAEVTAERWTRLDQALRSVADDAGGVADLRPGASAPADPELRRLMIGRAQVLERLGLAEPLGPACWALKPQAEETLRELAIRGDIIRTMHRAMRAAGVERAASDLAIHRDTSDPVTGRLLAQGLDDELKGTAYAVIDGIDGRVHLIRFPNLDATSDVPAGAVVELRRFADARGRERTALAVRSDHPIEQQVAAQGATWLDRRLLDREPVPLAGSGFGAEVTAALAARAEHLVGEGLARRQGQRVVFVRNLLDSLHRRELDTVAAQLSAETGLIYRPARPGQAVAGLYRQRLDLASGRFAMIDNGLGFQLVPWKPLLEQKIERQVAGVTLPGGGIDWTHARKRGLSL